LLRSSQHTGQFCCCFCYMYWLSCNVNIFL